jgi:hypothetical protein
MMSVLSTLSDQFYAGFDERDQSEFSTLHKHPADLVATGPPAFSLYIVLFQRLMPIVSGRIALCNELLL